MASDQVRVVVAREDAGARLDQFLAARIPGLSRRRARVAIDIGGVFVDGARTKVAGRTLRPGQVVVANLGGALDRATKAPGREARARDEAKLPPFEVVHQDEDLVIVDKPARLLTAPTPESDGNNLARLLAKRLGREVFVVHRLDLETSGLLAFALTSDANRALSELFRVHDIERMYLSMLAGRVEGDAHLLEGPIAGKRAMTRLEVVERLPEATLVRCKLETGRTHQIRIHAKGLGHPVMGDREHGPSLEALTAEAREREPPRMALHAAVLGFRHPTTGEAMRFERPWPEDLKPWLEELRRDGERPRG